MYNKNMIIRLRSRLIIGALPDYHSSIVSGRIDIVIISDGKEIKDFQLYHNRYKAIKAIRHTSINPIIITSQYPDFLIFIKITIIGIKCHRTDCPAFTHFKTVINAQFQQILFFSFAAFHVSNMSAHNNRSPHSNVPYRNYVLLICPVHFPLFNKTEILSKLCLRNTFGKTIRNYSNIPFFPKFLALILR